MADRGVDGERLAFDDDVWAEEVGRFSAGGSAQASASAARAQIELRRAPRCPLPSFSMADQQLLDEVARRLSQALGGKGTVILFGSHARGEARPGSDVDLLVIEPELRGRRAERMRLRKTLRGLGVPIDLILVSEDHAERWREVEGSLVREAIENGRTLVPA